MASRMYPRMREATMAVVSSRAALAIRPLALVSGIVFSLGQFE